VYYFLSYFHARRQVPAGAALQYVVPTGNFGDVLAGYFAKRMGLPIAQLVVATNANDILTRFWRTGRYEKAEQTTEEGAAAPAAGGSDGKQAAASVRETLSPAMDILVSSNFERLLWYLAYEVQGTDGSDVERRKKACAVLDGWMGKVKSNGRVEVPTAVLESARKDFLAERVSDEKARYSVYHTAQSLNETTDVGSDPSLPRPHAILHR
jgi:threonine synthase